MSEERLDRIEQHLSTISQQVAGLAIGQNEVRSHMLVLHEETLDRIQALAPERRLDPLEAAFRSRKKRD